MPGPADFTGTWVLDEDKSSFGKMGAGMAPARLDVVQKGTALSVKTTRIVEYADDQVSDETLVLDGSESHSQFMNSSRVVTAHLDAGGRAAVIDSVVSRTWGQPGAKMASKDTWTLGAGGSELRIHRVGSSFRGTQDVTMVFDKR
jgi:hypothetical protein